MTGDFLRSLKGARAASGRLTKNPCCCPKIGTAMKTFVLERVNARLQSIKGLPPRDFEGVPPPIRSDKRMPTHLFALAMTEDGREFSCVVQNLSAGGAGISMARINELPEEFLLAIDGYPFPTLVRLVWWHEAMGGVEFLKRAN
ncbi:MAG: PilZ domain-containing protein [Amphiplicatus sp.]